MRSKAETPDDPDDDVTPIDPDDGGSDVTPVDPDDGGSDVTPVDPDDGGSDVTPVDPDDGGSDVTPVDPDDGGSDVTPVDPDDSGSDVTPSNPQYRADIGAYLGNQWLARNLQMQTLFDREGASTASAEGSVWARIKGGKTDTSAVNGNIDMDSDYTQFQLGSDIAIWRDEQQSITFGLMASYLDGSTDSTGNRGADGSQFTATGDIDGYNLGAYATGSLMPGNIAAGMLIRGISMASTITASRMAMPVQRITTPGSRDFAGKRLSLRHEYEQR